MASDVVDLLVVGGGINGAGIARDAALRGLSVALVEKHDWGRGTSSRSSMLAHGGLRYLEQLEFGLVHEALQDRERMLRQAPHLVRPLRFLYPIYPDVAARRTVRAGLLLYDLLSHGRSVPGRAYLSKEEALRLAPGLEPNGLKGGATFYDGQIRQVERLVQELVWDARRHGADCRNHTAAVELLVAPHAGPQDKRAERRVTGVRVEGPDGEETLRARCVVNAAGAWVDEVLGPLGEGRPRKIRMTKGVHLVVPRFVDVALIVRTVSDGRTFFVLPWKQHCVVGTTDTDFQGDPAGVRAEPEDVAYLVEAARRYFPDAPLDEIRYTYAGVRALVNQEGLTESNVTRRHLLHDHGRKEGMQGLWTLQGGKITTYRTLAEETVDQVCRHLGRKDLARRHPTREGTLPGGPLVPWEEFRREAVRAARQEHGLSAPRAKHLVDTYGARWRQVLEGSLEDGAQQVAKGLPHVWAEVDFAVHEEQARTVGDVMVRRTDLGLVADGRPRVAKRVAKRMARLLERDRDWVKAQLRDYAHEASVFQVPEMASAS